MKWEGSLDGMLGATPHEADNSVSATFPALFQFINFLLNAAVWKVKATGPRGFGKNNNNNNNKVFVHEFLLFYV